MPDTSGSGPCHVGSLGAPGLSKATGRFKVRIRATPAPAASSTANVIPAPASGPYAQAVGPIRLERRVFLRGAAVAAGLATPSIAPTPARAALAQATLIGDKATVTFSRTGNQLHFFIITGLVARRLVLLAASHTNSLFVETAVKFFDPGGRVIAEMLSEPSRVLQETAAELRRALVVLDPIVREIDQTFVAPEIAAVLNAGRFVTYQMGVSLVFVSRGGDRYVLASTALAGVIAPAPNQPSLTPTSGFPTTRLVITDPFGRMVPGDLVLLYEVGSAPELGIAALDVVISADGTRAEATVPPTLGSGMYGVAVRETPHTDSRFPDLVFTVE